MLNTNFGSAGCRAYLAAIDALAAGGTTAAKMNAVFDLRMPYNAGKPADGEIAKFTTSSMFKLYNPMQQASIANLRDVAPDKPAIIDKIIENRFNSSIIRNLIFITNTVRFIRMKLSDELVRSRGVIVSSHASVYAGITEYGMAPFPSNESFGSDALDGSKRFSKDDTF